MLNWGGGPTSALILGERLECESLISWAPKDLHRREPYKWQKNLPRSAMPSWGAEQPTVRHKPPGIPGFVRSGAHSTAHETDKPEDNKTDFHQPPPSEILSSNAIVWLCWEIAGPSTIFLILTSNAEGNLLLSLWGGTSRDGFFLHLMEHQQSSALTERAVHFLN